MRGLTCLAQTWPRAHPCVLCILYAVFRILRVLPSRSQGYNQDKLSHLRTTCTSCAVGKYQGSTGQQNCLPCHSVAYGLGNRPSRVEFISTQFVYSNINRATVCKTCTPCNFGKRHHGGCTDGEFGRTGAASRDTICVPCTPGQVLPLCACCLKLCVFADVPGTPW